MPRDKKRKKYFSRDNIEEFFSVSSIHGFVYFSGKRNLGDRFIWAIAILASFTVAMTLIKLQIDESNADPLASNTETVSVEDVPFPGKFYRKVLPRQILEIKGCSPTLGASLDPLRHMKSHSIKKVQNLHLEHAQIALPQFSPVV